MCRIPKLLLHLSLCTVCSTSAFAFPLENGDFSDELNHWTYRGDVTVVSNEEAVLGDLNERCAPCAQLYQIVTVTDGLYEFAFDFFPALSVNVEDGAFPDFFSAALYFSSDVTSFDLGAGTGYNKSLALVQSDRNGNSVNKGEVSSSAKGTGWYHFSVQFSNLFDYVIPAFELFDGNHIRQDSLAEIDNVVLRDLSEIPEPMTMLLLGSGLLGLALRRKN